MKIDIRNKRYQTVTNLMVRFYADDGNEDGPIHGAVETSQGWTSTAWSDNGLNAGNRVEWNLKDLPMRIKGYMNIYKKMTSCYECGEFYYTKEDAEEHAQGRTIGYIEIDSLLKQWEVDI